MMDLGMSEEAFRRVCEGLMNDVIERERHLLEEAYRCEEESGELCLPADACVDLAATLSRMESRASQGIPQRDWRRT